MKAPELNFTVAGARYEIDLGDLTPQDARDFRMAVGMSPMSALGDADLDVVAGWVWLVRRRSLPNLTYAEVCGSFTYQDYFDGIGEQGEPVEAGDDPPSSGGHSES